MRMFFCRLLLLHVITRTSNGGPTPTSREENDMKLLNIIRRKYADSQTNDLNPIPMIASSIGGGCGMIASASIGKYTINDGQQISVPSKPNSNYTLKTLLLQIPFFILQIFRLSKIRLKIFA